MADMFWTPIISASQILLLSFLLRTLFARYGTVVMSVLLVLIVLTSTNREFVWRWLITVTLGIP